MTEEQWLSCTDPTPMLRWLRTQEGKLSERKGRLFACACGRGIWHLLTEQRSRDAVERAERYADGLDGEASLLSAHQAATHAYQSARTPVSRASCRSAVDCTAPEFFPRERYSARNDLVLTGVADAAAEAGEAAAQALAFTIDSVVLSAAWSAALANVKGTQSQVLRDICGNPFRPRPGLDAAWLGWGGGTVVSLARAVYEERRWGETPVLADALEEAGCDDAEMLGHLRRQGPGHVRGCWCLDLVLGKE
jgi:hypothetical protein